MHKNALFAALITLSAASNAAAVQVYGKANISLNNIDINNSDSIDLNSNASRFGVKGSYQINDNLKAIYKFEYETFVDDGEDGNTDDELKQRNIYAGFQGSFGTILAGKHDTPTKLAQGKVDLFSDQKWGDIKNIIEGENRVSNIIMYSTPKSNGLKATIAYVPDETAGSNTDGKSIAISYELDNLTMTLAHDKGEAIDSSVESLTRFVAEYKLGDIKLGAIAQNADKGSNEEDGYIVSASIKLDNGILLKGQYGESDDDVNDKTLSIIGADYKLNKKSKLFAYFSDYDQKGETLKEVETFAIGYEIKF